MPDDLTPPHWGSQEMPTQQMTDTELDHITDAALDAARAEIAALRAQLAEARAELDRRVDMHECAMAERDDATLYGVEQKARADRAEARVKALREAAQVAGDAAVAALLRHDPEATVLMQRMVRQTVANPIRAMLADSHKE